MQQAIALRKRLEPWFASVDGGRISELGVALRVDGSLGSFGPEGIENIVTEGGKIECDVVVADHGWAELSDADILFLLRERVLEGISACLKAEAVTFDPDSLASAAK
jgi:hypothetical protein